MKSCEAASLAVPPDSNELANFPSRGLTPKVVLYRIGRQDFAPWWFSSSKKGRFDLSSPYGTCYLADQEIGALLEVLGPMRRGGMVSREFLSRRVVWRLSLGEEKRCADSTARRSAGFGITGEIGTIIPYELCQLWASRLHAAGFNALIYWLRHDPARSEGVALFDLEGEKSWKCGRPRKISGGLIKRLESESGLRVAPAPRSDQLRFVEE